MTSTSSDSKSWHDANAIPPVYRQSNVTTQWRYKMFAFLILGLIGILKWCWSSNSIIELPHENTSKWNSPLAASGWTEWGEITPSEKLVWEPCFGMYGGRHQCARLIVPMDYHRPLKDSVHHPKVIIALVMLPGNNRTDSPSSYSTSPLLINPGGPGASGAMLALSGGAAIQAVVGEHYDIIGFDPRGVGATTPYANCFTREDTSELPGDIIERNRALINRVSWQVSGHDVGLVNSSNIALEKLNTRNRALSQLCKQADSVNGNNSIYKYVNTPNVARDMLSIIDAWDEWRGTADTSVLQGTDNTKDTKGKLVYWGFSYGTLLGATFSAMFPDRVGRVILDGVVDADHYVGHAWVDSLQDADAIWSKFSKYCFEAKGKCALYREGDAGADDILARYTKIKHSIMEQPLVGVTSGTFKPAVINWSDIQLLIFRSLYSPIDMFPGVAGILDLIERGVDLIALIGTDTPDIPALCHISQLPQWPDDALISIMCSDKRYKMNETLPELQRTFETIAQYSGFADVWMTLMLSCNEWSIEARDPPMRWDDHPAHDKPPVNTSFPLLFLSNRFDPVTPLQAALKMTKKFTNASIIEQISEGHCTTACPSLCTGNRIRAYLDQGIVPKPPIFDHETQDNHNKITGKWTICECDSKPWQPSQNTDRTSTVLTLEAHKTLQGLRDIQNALNDHSVKYDLFTENPLSELLLEFGAKQ